MADIEGGDVLFTFRGDASQLQAEIELTSSSLDQVSDDADSAGGSLRGLSSITRMASAEMGRGASAVTALTKGIGGMKLALGPATAAVVAVSAAVKLYQADQEEAARAQEVSTAISDGLRTANIKLKAAYEGLAVAAGDMTEAELKVARVRRQTFTENLPAVQKVSQALSEQVVAVMEAEQAISDLDPKQRNFADLNQVLTEGLQAEREELTRLTGQRDEAIALIEETTAVRIEEIKVTERRTAGMKAEAEAAREAARSEAERIAAIRAGMAAITSDADNTANEINAGMDQVVTNMEQAAIAMEQAIARDQAAIEGGISDTLTGVSQLSGQLAQNLAEDNAKAAMALFRTSQAAALGEVAMNTAVAITRSLAELGPIAGPVAAVGIGALGAAQAAAIASQAPPVAHIGTPAGGTMAPDERMSHGRKVLSTELSTPGAVANSTATQLIDDANNGKLNTGGGRLTAVIGRTHLDTELFRSGRQGSSRFSRLLRSNPHPKPQGGW